MRSSHRTLFPLYLTLIAATAPAQNTSPHWSTYFGGTQYEEGVVVRRGPGKLVTLVGHTTSSGLVTAGGLATAGAYQTANAGGADAFVARFDLGLPPASQLLWCTYLGGSNLELVFEAEIDPGTGITTVVGLSQSSNFPAAIGQGTPVLNGPSDGFVA